MAKLAGDPLTAEEYNAGPETYVPVVTGSVSNPTLGTDSTQLGWWYRLGRKVTAGWVIRFGAGMTAGSGVYLISLPLPVDLTYHRDAGFAFGMGSVIGVGAVRDDNVATANAAVALQIRGNLTVYMIDSDAADGIVSSGDPITLAAGDAFSGEVTYLTTAL